MYFLNFSLSTNRKRQSVDPGESKGVGFVQELGSPSSSLLLCLQCLGGEENLSQSTLRMSSLTLSTSILRKWNVRAEMDLKILLHEPKN